MSKKSFTILIIIFVLIGLFLLGFFLYRNAQKNNGGGPVTIKDLFPFGPGNPAQNNNNTTSGPQQTTGGPTVTPGQKIPRLRKVSVNPVIGYTTTQKRVPVDPNSIPAPKQVTITTSYAFSKEIKTGDTGTDVTELQKMLNQCPATQVAATGAGSPGKEGTLYGPATAKAITVFQELFADDILKPQNLTNGTGIVDAVTIKKLQAGFVCTFPVETPETVLKEIVRFVAEGTSNIFDAFADSLQTTRLSATTIPRVQQAFFGDQGAQVFLRSLEADNETIDTLIGKINEPVVGGDSLPELSVFAMPKNIADLTISPDGKQIFYLLPTGGNLVGFTSDLDGKNQKKVFSSQFFGWLSQWATPTKLVFTIKATAYATGYAYTTDLTKGDFTKVVGPVSALTTLMSPNGQYLLYSKNTKNGPALTLEDVSTNKTTNLGLYSLPEKCVWANDSASLYCAVPAVIPAGSVYPDSWYQGTVSFTDSFWYIDPTGNYDNRQLFSPLSEGGEPTDGVRLRVDDKYRYLYFMNRDTNILWQYDLTPPVEQAI